jgi:hypothetical protein
VVSIGRTNTLSLSAWGGSMSYSTTARVPSHKITCQDETLLTKDRPDMVLPGRRQEIVCRRHARDMVVIRYATCGIANRISKSRAVHSSGQADLVPCLLWTYEADYVYMLFGHNSRDSSARPQLEAAGWTRGYKLAASVSSCSCLGAVEAGMRWGQLWR